jgi:hypothetical protein
MLRTSGVPGSILNHPADDQDDDDFDPNCPWRDLGVAGNLTSEADDDTLSADDDEDAGLGEDDDLDAIDPNADNDDEWDENDFAESGGLIPGVDPDTDTV